MTQRRVSTANRATTVLARQLGGQLLAFREAVGLNQSQAAEVLSAQTAKVAKMERGWVPFRDPDIIALCKLYGVDDDEVVEGLLRLAKLDRERRKVKGWWNDTPTPNRQREYIVMEDAAFKIRQWQMALIPGLFQTPEYTRAMCVADMTLDDIDRIEGIVTVREKRQMRLHAAEPMQIHAVIWEAALRQLMGGPLVMGRQLAHLCALAERPNIRIQVLPFRAGAHTCIGGTFNILSFCDDEAVDVVHMESLRSTIWIEDAEESAVYTTLFDRVSRASLSPYDSIQFIDGLCREMSE